MDLKECKAELKRVEKKLATEHSNRIYYQNIVYHVCLVLDKYKNKRVVCGTSRSKSTEVEETLQEILDKYLESAKDYK